MQLLMTNGQIAAIVHAIRQSVVKGEVALFCGAGISHNSGLPLANELKRAILKELRISKLELKEIERSSLPFEAFMETVARSYSISEILHLFKMGEPNTNHTLVAKLARKGYIKTIVTTNFDLFFEKALAVEGLRRNSDFKVFYSEEQFLTNLDDLDNRTITIFKIHGSIEDEESIRTTLTEIARKSLSDKRMNVIRHLFSAGNHKIVLVLGYSCSDVFDITPQIQSISKNEKEVFLVEHADNLSIESIGEEPSKNPFTKFKGLRIKCNTDQFIRDLCGCFSSEIGEYDYSSHLLGWTPIIKNWGKEFHKNLLSTRYFILGSLFNQISNFKTSLKYFNKTLTIDKDKKDKQGQAACYGSLGNVNHSLGRFDKAISNYKIALRIAKQIGDFVNQASSFTNLGTVYFDLGDFKKAIYCHQKALETNIRIGDLWGEAADLAGLGNAFHSLDNYEKAVQYHQKSLEISRQLGAKTGEATCHANLGNIYRDLGNFEKSLEHHKASFEIARQIGDRALEARYYTNVGIICFDRSNFRKSLYYHKKSLRIAKQIEDHAMEANCLLNIGDAYFGLGKISEAANNYTKSQWLAKKTGQSNLWKLARDKLIAINL